MTRPLRKPMLIALLLAPAALAAVGCAPEPEVFDKAAIDGLHKMMVVPLQAAQEPSTGQIVAGLAEARLQTLRLPQMQVLEAPALWRLTATSTQPVSIPDEQALQAAQAVGADCLLTGTVTYAARTPQGASNLPPGMRGATGQSMEYQKSFLVREADVTVSVRILSVQSARVVYAFKADTKGLASSKLLSDAFQQAVKPFEEYLRSSRKN